MFVKRTLLIQVVLWTAVINGLLGSLISVQAITAGALPETLLGIIYLILQQIGHFQFFAFLLAIPFVILSILLPINRLVRSLLAATFFTFILLIVTDYAVFKLYHFHLNGMVWNLLTGGAIEEIFVFDIANFLSIGVIILLITAFQWGLQKYLTPKPNDAKFRPAKIISGKKAFLFIFLVQFSGQAIHAWSDTWYKTDILLQSQLIPLPMGLTMKRFLNKRGWAPEIKERQSIKVKAHREFNYPLKPLQCQSPKAKPNILFLVSDSLRFDMLTDDIMPNWSSLAKQSQRFEHHMSTGNATRFGIYGLFTGLFGHYWFDSLDNQVSSILINKLKSEDYRFGFFSNARLTSPEFDRSIFFSVNDFIPLKTPGDNVIERELKITEQTKSFISEKSERPFFGFVFFDAPHAYASQEQDRVFQPALDSINYLTLDNDTDPKPFFNRYKNSVHFVDRLSGELLQTLKDQNLIDNTIVILTGDHGQEVNDTHTNSWGHGSNFSKYQIQVPLAIYWPGKETQTFTHLTSHVDVVPTLLSEIFACGNKITDYSSGQSLLNQNERNFVLVKDWNSQAVINKDFVRVFQNIGVTRSLEMDSYKKTDIPAGVFPVNKVMGGLSQFYQ
ncbi:MAG: DUF3413 domain-containing protein [Bacteroidetes bacterium]|nr:DUF3413 domain-containing protein [Bacteroidota bacterium]